jgi:hypothetical protein
VVRLDQRLNRQQTLKIAENSIKLRMKQRTLLERMRETIFL